MNVFIAIVQAIKAAILRAWTAKAPAPAPVRVKLAGRNGYGNDGISVPRP
jgi:hypothetical protein